MDGLPPGLRGFAAAQSLDQQQQAGELQKAQTLLAIKQHFDAQNQQTQVRDIMSRTTDPNAAIPELMKAGPVGMQYAGQLAQINDHLVKQKQAADKAAFFSDANRQNYMRPGPSIPNATAVDDDGVPNLPAQGQGSLDFDKMLADAAARGHVNPEIYSNHLAQKEDRRARLEQQATLAREAQQGKFELAQQRAEDQRLTQAERNQARMDAIRLSGAIAHSNRQERMLPVQMPDGTIQYVPSSQAAGQQVGKPAPAGQGGAYGKQVQQLGTVFEKAKVNETHAVLKGAEDALAAHPEAAEYISGPKSVMPGVAIEKFVDGGKEINAARQATEKLFNVELKNRSGAAVTSQELERLKTEYGKGVFRTAAQLENAIKQARAIIEAHTRSLAAGFPPEVLDAYNDNLDALGGSRIISRPQSRGASGNFAPAQGGAQPARPPLDSFNRK